MADDYDAEILGRDIERETRVLPLSWLPLVTRVNRTLATEAGPLPSRPAAA